ncbi:transporter substrate-binding domain-containing protein [Pseudomonas sp. NyZ704]|nr:transporter substrate-binding domain-containing protein [Pseudomonas sp. NyZ704]
MAVKRYCALFALFLACWAVAVAPATAADTLRLNTDIFPPYQVSEGETLSGTSVDALECIFKTLRQPYSVRVMPWQRAIHEVGQGRADGFFSAANMQRANRFAALSAPLALEKWYWYSNRPDTAELAAVGGDSKLRIGAVRGSNQLAWLLENGYAVEQQVSSTEQLFKLLDMGRIDTFLADQRTLRTVLTKLPPAMRPEYERFQQYSTLGVYFSKAFLDNNRGFLQRFNQQIFFCLPEIHTLSGDEHKQLAALHEQLFSSWSERKEIVSAVSAQNALHQNLNIPEIMQLDRQWRDELKKPDAPLINSVAGNSLSEWLSDQQQKHNNLITEIIVTDQLGLNVGLSEITTDYWQGDEAKFSEAFFNRTDAAYQGRLEYDQSAQGYQVHISSQIRDPASNEVIGVLIIGLDIQRVLQANGLTGVN